MESAIKQQEITINVPYVVTKQRVSDLLCSAFEGGSNYWYEITECIAPPELEFRVLLRRRRRDKHLDYPLNEGGALMIGDRKDPEREPVRLDLETIKKGLGLFFVETPRHLADFMSESDDASTGDVFLQLCIFGSVVYG
jgi:hypothetical protein